MLCYIVDRNYEHIVKAHQNTPHQGQNQLSDEVKFQVVSNNHACAMLTNQPTTVGASHGINHWKIWHCWRTDYLASLRLVSVATFIFRLEKILNKTKPSIVCMYMMYPSNADQSTQKRHCQEILSHLYK